MISSKGNSKRGRPRKKVEDDDESSGEYIKRKVKGSLSSPPKKVRRQLLWQRRLPKMKKIRRKRHRLSLKSKFLKALTVMKKKVLIKMKRSVLR